MSNDSTEYTPEQLRVLLYQQRPEIFNGLRNTLAELFSIARTYAPLQKYDVTLQALGAIGQLLTHYLSLRDGDFLTPTSLDAIVGPTDFRFDTVLTETMEGLSALHKAALARGDIQLSQQLIDVLENLSLRSIEIRSFPHPPPGENPVTAFIQSYMFNAIQDGAVRGHDDITMTGARAQSNIGQVLLRRQLYLTSQSAITDLEKLAYISIAQRKPHVTGAPVRGLAEMLRLAVSEPVIGNHTIHAALRALQQVCEMELQFKSSPLDQGVRFALGAFLDLSEPTALANIEALAVERLSVALKEVNSEKVDRYRAAIGELNDDLWQRLVAIGTAAAATESFGLFYVNANIGDISKHLLWLYGLLKRTKDKTAEGQETHQQWRLQRFADDLLDNLYWIVGATYWRIFDAFKAPINTNLVWEFFPTLSAIGIRALDTEATQVAAAAISSLKSMAIACLDKPIQTYRSAARVAAYIARVGIIAKKTGHQDIYELSLNVLREFDEKQFSKQRQVQPDAKEYEVLLFAELRRLAEELQTGQSPWFLDEEDAMFFSRVVPNDIEEFLKRLSVKS